MRGLELHARHGEAQADGERLCSAGWSLFVSAFVALPVRATWLSWSLPTRAGHELTWFLLHRALG